MQDTNDEMAAHCEACGRRNELTVNEVLKDYLELQASPGFDIYKEALLKMFTTALKVQEKEKLRPYTDKNQNDHTAYIYYQLIKLIEKLISYRQDIRKVRPPYSDPDDCSVYVKGGPEWRRALNLYDFLEQFFDLYRFDQLYPNLRAMFHIALDTGDIEKPNTLQRCNIAMTFDVLNDFLFRLDRLYQADKRVSKLKGRYRVKNLN